MRRTNGGRQFPDTETIEHLRRKADGGCNGLHNKALACYRCNVERGEIDWLTYKSFRMGEIYLADVAAAITVAAAIIATNPRNSADLPDRRIAA